MKLTKELFLEAKKILEKAPTLITEEVLIDAGYVKIDRENLEGKKFRSLVIDNIGIIWGEPV